MVIDPSLRATAGELLSDVFLLAGAEGVQRKSDDRNTDKTFDIDRVTDRGMDNVDGIVSDL